MMDELISVIVPVYNVKNYLKQCVQSIVGQTYKNLEIILIDDGSTDGSGELCDILKKTDERIKVIHEENSGLSEARNTGLNAARGKYIGFVDSDDYIEPNMYDILIKLCKKNKTSVACARYRYFGIGNEPELPKANGLTKVMSGDEFLLNILNGSRSGFSTYSVWDRIYRWDIIRDLKFPKGKCYEDIVFTTKAVLKAKRVAYINRELYNYRLRNGSISYKKKNAVFDKKLITDRLPLQKEQIRFLDFIGKQQLADVARIRYYQEFIKFAAVNPYLEYETVIQTALREWKLTPKKISRLPVSFKGKLMLAAMAMAPSVFMAYYSKQVRTLKWQ